MGATAALMTVSTAATASGAYAQSQAQRSAGAYEKSTFDTNGRMANIQAEDAIRRGENDATKVKKQTKQLIGSQRAALAAQGLDLSSGDALAIQQDTAAIGAEDAQTVRNNAFREAWGFRVQANDYAGRGVMADLTAKNQSRNTILTGGLTVAKDLAGYNYQREYYGSGLKKAKP